MYLRSHNAKRNNSFIRGGDIAQRLFQGLQNPDMLNSGEIKSREILNAIYNIEEINKSNEESKMCLPAD